MTIEHTDLLTKCFYIKDPTNPNGLPKWIVEFVKRNPGMSQDLRSYRYRRNYIEVMPLPEIKINIVDYI